MPGGRPPNALVSIHRARPAAMREELRVAASLARTSPRAYPTPKDPLIVSASELRDFLRCRVKWWWRHQARLEPTSGTEALAIGSLTHEVLAHWYALDWKSARTVQAMRRIAKERIAMTTLENLTTEDRALVEAMTVGFASWARDPANPNGDRALGIRECVTEQYFELPLTDDGRIRVRGFIDNVFPSAQLKKTIGCSEFKTKGQIRTNDVETNLQLSVYLWALRRLYPKAKRYTAHYTILRKQMPGPRVTADLFHRETVERTDEEIEQWAIDTERAALDMFDAALYPNPNENCSWDCDFKIPCLLRGNAADLRHVLSTQYRQKVRT